MTVLLCDKVLSVIALLFNICLTIMNSVLVCSYEAHNDLNVSSLFLPWFGQLVAGLSPQKPGFDPRPVHMKFIVDRVALGQAILQVLQFSPVSITPPIHSSITDGINVGN
jgi:hypothetical protein